MNKIVMFDKSSKKSIVITSLKDIELDGRTKRILKEKYNGPAIVRMNGFTLVTVPASLKIEKTLPPIFTSCQNPKVFLTQHYDKNNLAIVFIGNALQVLAELPSNIFKL